jgi:hypothetical protein
MMRLSLPEAASMLGHGGLQLMLQILDPLV